MDCKKQPIQLPLLRWAETQAHIPRHAHLMSPILSACHRRFRNTGLTPRQCAPGAIFPYPSQLSQLKD
ncbi:MAG: hypothetical protein ACRDD5_11905 [Silvania sp.]|uniref:protein YnhH n=1 Tax=Silvania TaxID=3016631 RepID=UPI003AF150FD